MKHLLRSSLLFFVSAAPGQAAFAPAASEAFQQSEGLPSAREIVERFAAETKLKESLEKTRSMHATGRFTLTAMEINGTLEVWSAKPNRRFFSVDMGPFGKSITGFDGKTGWSTHPMLGARLLSGSELLQTQLESGYDAALKTSDHYESMRTVGRETFEGKDCHAVEFVAKPLEGMDPASTLAARTSREYYEIASGLLIGAVGRQESEMGDSPYTALSSDYQDFGGWLMATKTVIRISGQEFALTIDSVEYDTATEATFALPLEIQKLVEAASAPAAPPAGDAPKPK